MGIRFSFDGTGRTTHTQSVGLAMVNQALLSGTSLRFGAHVCVSETHFAVQKFNASTTTFTDLNSGSLQRALKTDGTVYQFELWRAASTLTVLLPDGQIVTATDNDVSSWSGTYGFYEFFMTSGATDAIPAITQAWYDVAATQNSPKLADPVSREDLDDATADKTAAECRRHH